MIAREFSCGCIEHPTRGRIRKCAGLPSRSMTGRVVAPEGDKVTKHSKSKVVQRIEVGP